MTKPEIEERVKKLREAGRSIRLIAQHLKLGRKKVREILKERVPKETKAQKKRTSLLEPFRKRVEALVKENCTAALILRKIRKEGYSGGYTILQELVGNLRGPRRERKAYTRFETLPGEELQQDWSPYKVQIDGKPVVVQLFSTILCWSRFQFLRAYLDQKFNSLIWGHVAAFHHFHGVPWRCVYDNQKAITPFWIGGKPVINDKFLEFSKHYGFEIQVCYPGDCERKGKIERPFDYFEKAFLPTRIFHSLEDLNQQIERWLDSFDGPGEGNHRVHGTTREVPYQRWLEEKEYLYELPATDHLPRKVEERLVNPDLTISVLGNLYTVPLSVEGKKVWVSIGEKDLQVFNLQGEVVARHQLLEKKGGIVIDEAHYKEIKRKRKSVSLPQMEREFLARFPGAQEFLNALKKTVRSIAPIHLREILGLARRYRVEEVEKALSRALSDGTATSGYVRQLLGRSHPTGHLAQLKTDLPKGLSLGPIDCGSADGYEDIFDGNKN